MHLRSRGLSRAAAWAVVAALVAVGLQGVHVSSPTVVALADSATPFSANVPITDNTTGYPQHVEPTLVVDAHGVLNTGWKEALTPTGPGQRVGFARSVDGGRTWSANTLKATTEPGLLQSDPWLTLDEQGGLHYASLEYSANGTYGGVTVINSADGGRTWSAPVPVDDRAGFADKESMASDGNGTLYVTYDNVLGNNFDVSTMIEVVITHSRDGGATWSPTASIVGTAGNYLGPVVAARPGGAVTAVVWNLTLGNVLAFHSSDYGDTWGSPVRVNAAPGSATSLNNTWITSMPSVLADPSGRLAVAWADHGSGTWDILVSTSDDNGSFWSSPASVSDVTSGDQWMPSLFLDARGTLHAAWLDGRTGAWNVYYANSTDFGRSWSPSVRVTTAGTPLTFVRPGDYLALAADGNGTAYVAWTDGRGGSLVIDFARSTPFPVANESPPLPWLPILAFAVGAAGIALLAVWILRRRHQRDRGGP